MLVIFAFGGIMTLSGKTNFLGKNMESDIKPEHRRAYCREMSIPMFVLAAVEAADVVLQLTAGFAQWSVLLLGAGLVLGVAWIMAIQKKYTKM